MARTKGALNKRTRAAMREAMDGTFEKGGSETISYLLRVAKDSKREDAVRMQAANIVLPYLRPKLSAVETSTAEEIPPKADLIENIMKILEQFPDLRAKISNQFNADLASKPDLQLVKG